MNKKWKSYLQKYIDGIVICIENNQTMPDSLLLIDRLSHLLAVCSELSSNDIDSVYALKKEVIENFKQYEEVMEQRRGILTKISMYQRFHKQLLTKETKK